MLSHQWLSAWASQLIPWTFLLLPGRYVISFTSFVFFLFSPEHYIPLDLIILKSQCLYSHIDLCTPTIILSAIYNWTVKGGKKVSCVKWKQATCSDVQPSSESSDCSTTHYFPAEAFKTFREQGVGAWYLINPCHCCSNPKSLIPVFTSPYLLFSSIAKVSTIVFEQEVEIGTDKGVHLSKFRNVFLDNYMSEKLKKQIDRAKDWNLLWEKFESLPSHGLVTRAHKFCNFF